MEPTSSNASAKVISALIIGLIVGFVAGAFWQERRLGSTEGAVSADVSETEVEEGKKALAADAETDGKMSESKATKAIEQTAAVTASVVLGSVPKLTVSNQTGGEHVFVTASGVDAPVWVAVREEKDGTLGNILGARKVFADTADIDIPLLRPTVPGGSYVLVMYEDVGETAFNHKEDILIEEGQVRFTAN